MANSRKKISELPALSVASLDTTFVLGISGSTTYKISINNLTSSLDGAFATDLVTNALSNTLDTKLSTSSFNSYTQSFTASVASGTISGSSQLTSSFDQRYVISGSITQTTWDNIASKPGGIVSSSIQISDLGFVTGSYTTINSFNSLTQSFNSISQSFNVISGSVVSIQGGFDTGSYQTFTSSVNTSISNLNTFTASVTTASIVTSISNLNTFTASISTASLVTSISNLNTFTASQSTSSLVDRLNAIESVSGSWITESETGSFLTSLSGAISSSTQITAFGFISSSQTIDSGSLLTTSSFNSYTASISTASLVTSISNLNTFTASVSTASLVTSITNLNTFTASVTTASLVTSITNLNTTTASLNTSVSSLNTFTASQSTASLVTSISNLNSFTQSFSTSVDNRLDTLEASIITGSTNYTQVLGNRRTSINSVGTSIISGSITTTGNPVQIMVTGDANPTTTAWCRLQIYRNETAIGNIVQVENSSNLNVPYCLNVIDTPSAGTYTYSMRTVDAMSGFFDFGESTGPLLTAVELRTNTNLPSTNNTFTGTNRFNGQVTLGGVGGDEGGELRLVTAETNTTLTGGYVSADIYQNRLRFFEGGGNNKGVYVDLSKTPDGNAGELMWKVSGFVNAGTFVSLDNIKATITTGGQRGLSIAAVSTSFTANISSTFGFTGGGAGSSTNGFSVTTTPSNSLFNYGFNTEGDGSTYIINDRTNNRVYRITKMIGFSFNNNFISIERLF